MLDYLRIMLNARLAKMDERGASAVEYGLLVAGIAAVIVAIVFILGGTLSGVFNEHQRLDREAATDLCWSQQITHVAVGLVRQAHGHGLKGATMAPHPPLQRLQLHVPAPGCVSRRDERGASAVEYGLLVAGIAAVIVAAVFLFGEGVFTNLFQETCNSINQNMGGNCS